MTKSSKDWDERRRKRQACNARRNKPWKNATGPKSDAGKKRSSMNAYKHGKYSASFKTIKEGLRLHRAFLRHVSLFLATEMIRDQILANKRSKGKANKNKGDSPA